MAEDLTQKPQEETEATEAPEQEETPQAPQEGSQEVSEPSEEEEVSPEAIQESDEKEGMKEQAGVEGAKELADELDEEEEYEPVVPSFFVGDDDEGNRHKVELDILVDPKTGRVVSVSRAGLGLDYETFKPLRHSGIWLEFSVPSYDDMATYRTKSMEFNRDAGRELISGITLRSWLISYHLKDWNLTDKKGEKVELKFDEEETGRLLQESLAKVFDVKPPTVIDVALTLFERDVILV